MVYLSLLDVTERKDVVSFFPPLPSTLQQASSPNSVSICFALLPSVATGLYRAGFAGCAGFQQNRNIKGELAQASVFVFLKGTTAPTGFPGRRDVQGGGRGAFPPHLILFSLASLLHTLPLSCASPGPPGKGVKAATARPESFGQQLRVGATVNSQEVSGF